MVRSPVVVEGKEWRVYSYWATAYEVEHGGVSLRDARIEALCWFLARCVRAAPCLDRSGAWWSEHALWAVQRLDALGYEFPDVDAPSWRMVA